MNNEETKLNELVEKLKLQGYALILISTLIEKSKNECEFSNEKNVLNDEITKIISKK